MKKIVIIGFLIASGFIQAQTVTLKVIVKGLANNNGQILVGVYNNETDFLKKNYTGNITSIQNKEAFVVFKNLPIGDYAISTFHDENNNKKLDTNFMGIPKEAYGFSNDAKGFMGAPKFNVAKINLDKDKTIIIDLKKNKS